MKKCLFCKIIAGDIPAYKIYEDEYLLAFLDIFPAHEGHVLLIPKKHANDVRDLDINASKIIIGVSKQIIAKMESVLHVEDFNIIQNNGSFAGQEIFHYHMHIIPRYTDRGKSGSCEAIHPSSYKYSHTKEDIKILATKLQID